MIKKILKILITVIIGYGVFLITTEEGTYWTRFKFYRLLLTKPIEKIRDEYSTKDCTKFSSEEKINGYFEAFVTGYCKPKAVDYKQRKDFLCAIALNCSCPYGINEEETCSSNSLSWQACNNFDDKVVMYCNKTASSLEPEDGHVAADWKCFPKGTALEIENKIYKVTDKGGVIKGRRIDVWFDDCEKALEATGIYKVNIPNL